MANEKDFSTPNEENSSRLTRQDTTCKTTLHPTELKPNQEGSNACAQILLAVCTMGIEMCATFVQIFSVLFMQFLGVPTALVSMNGVMAGASGLVILPVVGWFSDRGNNPVARKLSTMFLSVTVYLAGLSGLAVCGVFKIVYFDEMLLEIGNNRSDFNSTQGVYAPQNKTLVASIANSTKEGRPNIGNSSPELLLEYLPITTSMTSSTPTSAYVAIACFACLDIGFDISMALSRAFMLECVPCFQHTRLLVTASAIQSLSGLAFAFLGTLDLSDQLNVIFKVNGTAASIVFYAVFLAFVVVVSFSCSMTTGYILLKKRKGDHDALSGKRTKGNVEEAKLSNKSSEKLAIVRNMWKRMSQRKSATIDLEIHEDNEKRPLLVTKKQGCFKPKYLSLSYSTSRLHSLEDSVTTNTNSLEKGVYRSMSLSSSYELKNSTAGILEKGLNQNQNDLEIPHIPDEEKLYAISGKQLTNSHPADAVSAIGAFKTSYSMSLSMAHSTLGVDQEVDTIRHRGTESNARICSSLRKTNEEANAVPKRSQSNKRLIILCISSFLTIGSMLCSIAYTGNALTLDIYHGVPTALPGSEGYIQYKKGVTNSAWGNFAMYATFTLVSLTNKKLIDLIGEKIQFTLSHIIFISCNLAFLVAKTEEFFFVSMAMAGLQRMCVYTLPYILANKFTQETQDNSHSPSQSSKRGRVMTLIGFLIPLHYITVSAMIGPLMDATGDVWVPVIYSVVTATLAVIIFGLLFVVKE